MKPITDYKTLIFDCDGVVLNSNAIKSEAFYQVALPFGHEAAQALVDYHVENGGISRYEKFHYFLNEIVADHPDKAAKGNLETLLSSFAEIVKKRLLSCEVAEGLDVFRNATFHARWLVVSGSDQKELREIFLYKGLVEFFDGGIFGSPDTKEAILHREFDCGNICKPALLFGDSKYDYHAALSAGVDFIFTSKWSEVADWQNWVSRNKILYCDKVADLISEFLNSNQGN